MIVSPFSVVSIPRQCRGLSVVAKETTNVVWQCYRLLNSQLIRVQTGLLFFLLLPFSLRVLQHIESYTVPQYGDAPNDEVESWSIEECLLAVKKYNARDGKNSREGQQELDFLKMAHFVQIAADKYQEAAK